MANKKTIAPPLLSDGLDITSGKDVQRLNIMAARMIAEMMRSTLGPMGMDKMLIDSLGDIVVTNDGATILREMDVQHPVARMMVEIARSQELSVGDGTTSAVVIAGELLKHAGELFDMGIHPVVITRGYRLATVECQRILEQIAQDMPDNDQMLRAVAMTTMTGKGVEQAKELLSDIVIKAIRSVAQGENNPGIIDSNYIKLEKKEGATAYDTEFVRGVVLDKEKAHDTMPSRVESARIALLKVPLELKTKEVNAQISVTTPEQFKAFIAEQRATLKEMAASIKASGATVLFSEKSIDDLCLYHLAQEGILAVRRVRRADMEKLARATGGTVLASLDELSSATLGYAGLVEERTVSGAKLIYVTECGEPKSVTILIRGGTKHVVDEMERAAEDCLGALSTALIDRKIVAGGGAVEIELARQLRSFSKDISTSDRLAIEAFADSLEIIPKALAENSGLSPLDVLAELRYQNEKMGSKIGFDALSGQIKDMLQEGIIEPVRVKKQAISSASEVTIMILRINEIISAARLSMPTPEDAIARASQARPEQGS